MIDKEVIPLFIGFLTSLMFTMLFHMYGSERVRDNFHGAMWAFALSLIVIVGMKSLE